MSKASCMMAALCGAFSSQSSHFRHIRLDLQLASERCRKDVFMFLRCKRLFKTNAKATLRWFPPVHTASTFTMAVGSSCILSMMSSKTSVIASLNNLWCTTCSMIMWWYPV